MNIIIKGMDMPKSCGECGEVWCEHWQYSWNLPYESYKSPDCPLIEIELVRCGECNRSGTDGENTFCMWMGALRQPTDFCSYGERRDDERINE